MLKVVLYLCFLVFITRCKICNLIQVLNLIVMKIMKTFVLFKLSLKALANIKVQVKKNKPATSNNLASKEDYSMVKIYYLAKTRRLVTQEILKRDITT